MTRTVLRAAGAAGLALALALMGLVPGAFAATVIATVSGRVALPTGAAGEPFYVRVYTEQDRTWEAGRSALVRADGTFELPGLDAGVDYRLELSTTGLDHVDGFWAGNGTTLAPTAAEGRSVRAPAQDLLLTPVAATTIRGTVTPSFPWDGEGLRVLAIELPRTGVEGISVDDFGGFIVHGAASTSHAEVEPDGGGAFTIPKIRPGAQHVLLVSDPDPARFAPGYFHAGAAGLVEHLTQATWVRGGATVAVRVGTEFVEPALRAAEAPSITGTPVVGTRLNATGGWWSLPGVSLHYQWLRDGRAITGATSAAYTPVAGEVGARLTVRVTARKDGYADAVATSPAVTVRPKAAPAASTRPTVTGTARVGGKLTAAPGTWTVPGVTHTYQWLRDGKAIKGATGRTYRPVPKDAGARLAVRVTARASGHAEGQATSSVKKIAKGKPKVTATVKPVKAGKRAKVTVKVTARGIARPTGKLKVKYGKKTVRATLTAASKGKVSVRLPKLTKGRYKVTVTFSPTKATKKAFTSATSSATTLRVR